MRMIKVTGGGLGSTPLTIRGADGAEHTFPLLSGLDYQVQAGEPTQLRVQFAKYVTLTEAAAELARLTQALGLPEVRVIELNDLAALW